MAAAFALTRFIYHPLHGAWPRTQTGQIAQLFSYQTLISTGTAIATANINFRANPARRTLP
jgi:hypothetical protein